MDTTVGKRDQLLLAGRSSILCITVCGEGERRHELPSSLLTLIRFARLMSSAVMVLCVGTVLSSCCGWICSGWFSDCCSSADCVSDGTGVCSCCSNPFSVACPASSNCPLLEKCSKSCVPSSHFSPFSLVTSIRMNLGGRPGRLPGPNLLFPRPRPLPLALLKKSSFSSWELRCCWSCSELMKRRLHS